MGRKSVIDYDRETTCCFTGHRSRDLPGRGDMNVPAMRRLYSLMYLHVVEAYRLGMRTFISGMAEGADLFFAGIVNDMAGSGKYPGLRLVGAVPYDGQSWEIKDEKDRYAYDTLLKKWDYVVISTRWDKTRYWKRNYYMVNNSSMLIAVKRQKQGGSGTSQTVRLAEEAGIRLDIIDLDRELLVSEELDRLIKEGGPADLPVKGTEEGGL